MKSENKQKDEIGVVVQSWLWVWVNYGLIVSPLERLNGIQRSWVKIEIRPTFYSYFEESSSGELSYTYVTTSKKFRLNWTFQLTKAVDKVKSNPEPKGEIRSALQSWIWVQVELMAQ